MYDYIKGILADLTPTTCTIEASGVGYLLNISLSTYSYLESKKAETDVKVFVHLIVREDEHLLFGFADKLEREIFRLLISVSGVGANSARTILSTYNSSELVQIISGGDANAIKKVKGIGPKTAQKIVIDIKDKVTELAAELGDDIVLSGAGNSQLKSEAITALSILGYAQAAADKAVSQIIKDQPDITIEKLIKEALKRL